MGVTGSLQDHGWVWAFWSRLRGSSKISKMQASLCPWVWLHKRWNIDSSLKHVWSICGCLKNWVREGKMFFLAPGTSVEVPSIFSCLNMPAAVSSSSSCWRWSNHLNLGRCWHFTFNSCVFRGLIDGFSNSLWRCWQDFLNIAVQCTVHSRLSLTFVEGWHVTGGMATPWSSPAFRRGWERRPPLNQPCFLRNFRDAVRVSWSFLRYYFWKRFSSYCSSLSLKGTWWV